MMPEAYLLTARLSAHLICSRPTLDPTRTLHGQPNGQKHFPLFHPSAMMLILDTAMHQACGSRMLSRCVTTIGHSFTMLLFVDLLRSISSSCSFEVE